MLVSIIVLVDAQSNYPGDDFIDWQSYYTEYAGIRAKPGFRDGYRAEALFDGPMGIAVTSSDPGSIFRIFVADTNNHCIRRLDWATGRISTVAGSYTMPGLLDGPGMRAKFRYPITLGTESTGENLFVLDNGNRIRWIDLRQTLQSSGALTTVRTLMHGACRPVAQWTVFSSIIMRSVGCHPDWIDETVDTFERSFHCYGHTATCAPRNHPAQADKRSTILLEKPQDSQLDKQ